MRGVIIATSLALCLSLASAEADPDPRARLAARPRAFDFAADVNEVVGEITEEFNCDGLGYGYYADQFQDCKVFHICMPVKSNTGKVIDTFQFSFFCPNQTRFSQDTRTCISDVYAYPCHDAHKLYDLNKAIGQQPKNRRKALNTSFRKSVDVSPKAKITGNIDDLFIGKRRKDHTAFEIDKPHTPFIPQLTSPFTLRPKTPTTPVSITEASFVSTSQHNSRNGAVRSKVNSFNTESQTSRQSTANRGQTVDRNNEGDSLSFNNVVVNNIPSEPIVPGGAQLFSQTSTNVKKAQSHASKVTSIKKVPTVTSSIRGSTSFSTNNNNNSGNQGISSISTFNSNRGSSRENINQVSSGVKSQSGSAARVGSNNSNVNSKNVGNTFSKVSNINRGTIGSNAFGQESSKSNLDSSKSTGTRNTGSVSSIRLSNGNISTQQSSIGSSGNQVSSTSSTARASGFTKTSQLSTASVNGLNAARGSSVSVNRGSVRGSSQDTSRVSNSFNQGSHNSASGSTSSVGLTSNSVSTNVGGSHTSNSFNKGNLNIAGGSAATGNRGVVRGSSNKNTSSGSSNLNRGGTTLTNTGSFSTTTTNLQNNTNSGIGLSSASFGTTGTSNAVIFNGSNKATGSVVSGNRESTISNIQNLLAQRANAFIKDNFNTATGSAISGNKAAGIGSLNINASRGSSSLNTGTSGSTKTHGSSTASFNGLNTARGSSSTVNRGSVRGSSSLDTSKVSNSVNQASHNRAIGSTATVNNNSVRGSSNVDVSKASNTNNRSNINTAQGSVVTGNQAAVRGSSSGSSSLNRGGATFSNNDFSTKTTSNSQNFKNSGVGLSSVSFGTTGSSNSVIFGSNDKSRTAESSFVTQKENNKSPVPAPLNIPGAQLLSVSKRPLHTHTVSFNQHNTNNNNRNSQNSQVHSTGAIHTNVPFKTITDASVVVGKPALPSVGRGSRIVLGRKTADNTQNTFSSQSRGSSSDTKTKSSINLGTKQSHNSQTSAIHSSISNHQGPSTLGSTHPLLANIAVPFVSGNPQSTISNIKNLLSQTANAFTKDNFNTDTVINTGSSITQTNNNQNSHSSSINSANNIKQGALSGNKKSTGIVFPGRRPSIQTSSLNVNSGRLTSSGVTASVGNTNKNIQGQVSLNSNNIISTGIKSSGISSGAGLSVASQVSASKSNVKENQSSSNILSGSGISDESQNTLNSGRRRTTTSQVNISGTQTQRRGSNRQRVRGSTLTNNRVGGSGASLGTTGNQNTNSHLQVSLNSNNRILNGVKSSGISSGTKLSGSSHVVASNPLENKNLSNFNTLSDSGISEQSQSIINSGRRGSTVSQDNISGTQSQRRGSNRSQLSGSTTTSSRRTTNRGSKRFRIPTGIKFPGKSNRQTSFKTNRVTAVNANSQGGSHSNSQDSQINSHTTVSSRITSFSNNDESENIKTKSNIPLPPSRSGATLVGVTKRPVHEHSGISSKTESAVVHDQGAIHRVSHNVQKETSSTFNTGRRTSQLTGTTSHSASKLTTSSKSNIGHGASPTLKTDANLPLPPNIPGAALIAVRKRPVVKQSGLSSQSESTAVNNQETIHKVSNNVQKEGGLTSNIGRTTTQLSGTASHSASRLKTSSNFNNQQSSNSRTSSNFPRTPSIPGATLIAFTTRPAQRKSSTSSQSASKIKTSSIVNSRQGTSSTLKTKPNLPNPPSIPGAALVSVKRRPATKQSSTSTTRRVTSQLSGTASLSATRPKTSSNSNKQQSSNSRTSSNLPRPPSIPGATLIAFTTRPAQRKSSTSSQSASKIKTSSNVNSRQGTSSTLKTKPNLPNPPSIPGAALVSVKRRPATKQSSTSTTRRVTSQLSGTASLSATRPKTSFNSNKQQSSNSRTSSNLPRPPSIPGATLIAFTTRPAQRESSTKQAGFKIKTESKTQNINKDLEAHILAAIQAQIGANVGGASQSNAILSAIQARQKQIGSAVSGNQAAGIGSLQIKTGSLKITPSKGSSSINTGTSGTTKTHGSSTASFNGLNTARGASVTVNRNNNPSKINNPGAKRVSIRKRPINISSNIEHSDFNAQNSFTTVNAESIIGKPAFWPNVSNGASSTKQSNTQKQTKAQVNTQKQTSSVSNVREMSQLINSVVTNSITQGSRVGISGSSQVEESSSQGSSASFGIGNQNTNSRKSSNERITSRRRGSSSGRGNSQTSSSVSLSNNQGEILANAQRIKSNTPAIVATQINSFASQTGSVLTNTPRRTISRNRGNRRFTPNPSLLQSNTAGPSLTNVNNAANSKVVSNGQSIRSSRTRTRSRNVSSRKNIASSQNTQSNSQATQHRDNQNQHSVSTSNSASVPPVPTISTIRGPTQSNTQNANNIFRSNIANTEKIAEFSDFEIELTTSSDNDATATITEAPLLRSTISRNRSRGRAISQISRKVASNSVSPRNNVRNSPILKQVTTTPTPNIQKAESIKERTSTISSRRTTQSRTPTRPSVFRSRVATGNSRISSDQSSRSRLRSQTKISNSNIQGSTSSKTSGTFSASNSASALSSKIPKLPKGQNFKLPTNFNFPGATLIAFKTTPVKKVKESTKGSTSNFSSSFKTITNVDSNIGKPVVSVSDVETKNGPLKNSELDLNTNNNGRTIIRKKIRVNGKPGSRKNDAKVLVSSRISASSGINSDDAKPKLANEPSTRITYGGNSNSDNSKRITSVRRKAYGSDNSEKNDSEANKSRILTSVSRKTYGSDSSDTSKILTSSRRRTYGSDTSSASSSLIDDSSEIVTSARRKTYGSTASSESSAHNQQSSSTSSSSFSSQSYGSESLSSFSQNTYGSDTSAESSFSSLNSYGSSSSSIPSSGGRSSTSSSRRTYGDGVSTESSSASSFSSQKNQGTESTTQSKFIGNAIVTEIIPTTPAPTRIGTRRRITSRRRLVNNPKVSPKSVEQSALNSNSFTSSTQGNTNTNQRKVLKKVTKVSKTDVTKEQSLPVLFKSFTPPAPVVSTDTSSSADIVSSSSLSIPGLPPGLKLRVVGTSVKSSSSTSSSSSSSSLNSSTSNFSNFSIDSKKSKPKGNSLTDLELEALSALAKINTGFTSSVRGRSLRRTSQRQNSKVTSGS